MTSSHAHRPDRAEPPIRIFLIDDDSVDRAAVIRCLRTEEPKYQVHEASDGASGFAAIDAHSFDCILLDYHLPDARGLDLLDRLLASAASDFTPIIMLTGDGTEDLAVAALKMGASDYISKSRLEPREFEQAIDSAILRALQDRMTRRKHDKLFALAFEDDLTGLPNRRHFMDRLEHAVALARRANHPIGLAYLDLDGFKAINDTFGHSAGDEVIRGVAHTIKDLIRAADTAARIGGDEFAVLIEANTDVGGVRTLVERIRDAVLATTFRGQAIGVSVGSVVGCPRHHDTRALLHMADQMMYRAKASKEGIAILPLDEAELL